MSNTQLQNTLTIKERELLRALAEQDSKKATLIENEIDNLKQEITTEANLAKEKSSQSKKKKERKIKPVKEKKQLFDFSVEGKKVEVVRGYPKTNLVFLYQELFEKMKNILNAKEKFSIGTSYEGHLSVEKTLEKVKVFYVYYNQGGDKRFSIESNSFETIDLFLKGTHIINTHKDPLFDHSICGPEPSKDAYIYSPDEIIEDMFHCFANELYGD